jgi:hypothetical protein
MISQVWQNHFLCHDIYVAAQNILGLRQVDCHIGLGCGAQ